MAALVDSNILVYRFDSRFAQKQRLATELLRRGLAAGSLLIPHQAVLEFTVATTRKQKDGFQILAEAEAVRAAEDILLQFEICYPTEQVIRTALHGAMTYQLSWWDAHLWAYAECLGLKDLYSEDFQHGRVYGKVRVLNPFVSTG